MYKLIFFSLYIIHEKGTRQKIEVENRYIQREREKVKNIEETMNKSKSLYESKRKKIDTEKRKKETDESHKGNIFYKYAKGDRECKYKTK